MPREEGESRTYSKPYTIHFVAGAETWGWERGLAGDHTCKVHGRRRTPPLTGLARHPDQLRNPDEVPTLFCQSFTTFQVVSSAHHCDSSASAKRSGTHTEGGWLFEFRMLVSRWHWCSVSCLPPLRCGTELHRPTFAQPSLLFSVPHNFCSMQPFSCFAQRLCSGIECRLTARAPFL